MHSSCIQVSHIIIFLLVVCGSHLVLETSQQMTDIPYGDYFKVEVNFKSFLER